MFLLILTLGLSLLLGACHPAIQDADLTIITVDGITRGIDSVFALEEDSWPPSYIAESAQMPQIPLLPPSNEAPLSSVEIFERISPAIAFIETRSGLGSGVLLEQGYLVSNAHVVWPYETVRVVFADGTEYLDAPVLAWDLVADLAIIGPLESHIAPLNFVDGQSLKIGSTIYLIGYPGEVEAFPQPSITKGLLSRVRTWDTIDLSFFQIDAAITGGQSGGVLVTERGEIIGLSTFYFTATGFGLASSTTDIVPRLNAILRQEDDITLSQRRLLTDERLTDYQDALNSDVDTRTYIINEPVGTIVEISVAGNGHPDFAVLDIFGNLIGLSQAWDDVTHLGAVTIEYDVPYLVHVRQSSLNQHPFHLSSSHPLMAYTDLDDGLSLNLGESHLGSLDMPGDLDYYKINLTKDQIVEIEVDSLRIDPTMTLFFISFGHEEVVYDDDSGEGIFGVNAKVTYQAPADGTYTILISHVDDSSVGGYYISFSTAPDDAILTPLEVERAFIESPYGRFVQYDSQTFNFHLQYPAHWSVPHAVDIVCSDVTLCLTQEGVATLAIVEEDLVTVLGERPNLAPGKLTEEYIALNLENLRDGLPGFNFIRRDTFVTPQNLEGEVLTFSGIGGIEAIRFIYVDEAAQTAFNATYFSYYDLYEQLEDLFFYSLSTFRVWNPATQALDPIFHLDEGLKLAASDEYEAAIESYNQAIALDPDLTQAYTHRANSYEGVGEFDKAIADFTTAISQEPMNSRLYSNRALAYWINSETEEARRDIDQAIWLESNFPELYNMRALIKTSQGQYRSALADIRKYQTLNEGFLLGSPLDTRGYIYLNLGAYRQAKADFDELFRRDLRHAYALLGGGLAAAGLGQVEEARSLIEEGLKKVKEIQYADPQLGYLIEQAEQILMELEGGCSLTKRQLKVIEKSIFTFRTIRTSDSYSIILGIKYNIPQVWSINTEE